MILRGIVGSHVKAVESVTQTKSDAGKPLQDNAVDPHYRLTFGGSTAYAATEAGGFPIPPWLGSNSMSAWISPAPDTVGLSDGLGTYNYRYETTFNLDGFFAASARLAGRWATGNGGVDILINGVSTGLGARPSGRFRVERLSESRVEAMNRRSVGSWARRVLFKHGVQTRLVPPLEHIGAGNTYTLRQALDRIKNEYLAPRLSYLTGAKIPGILTVSGSRAACRVGQESRRLQIALWQLDPCDRGGTD